MKDICPLEHWSLVKRKRDGNKDAAREKKKPAEFPGRLLLASTAYSSPQNLLLVALTSTMFAASVWFRGVPASLFDLAAMIADPALRRLDDFIVHSH
jgi:hypothetical protein